jgi:hypothetical protein
MGRWHRIHESKMAEGAWDWRTRAWRMLFLNNGWTHYLHPQENK